MNALTSIAPTDLRGSSPTQAGGGRLHDPDPVAVQHLRQMLAAKQASSATAVASPAPQVAVKTATTSQPAAETAVNPDIYPAAVRAAAEKQLAKAPKTRRFNNVITPEVAAIWQRWIGEGKTVEWIAEHNGLIPMSPAAVYNNLKRHNIKARAPKMAVKTTTQTAAPKKPAAPPRPVAKAASKPAAERQPEGTAEVTPVTEPIEVVEAAEVIEAPEAAVTTTQTTATGGNTASDTATITRVDPAPNITQPAQLSSLAALLDMFAREPMQLRGSIKLNLEIEFGDSDQ